MSTIMNTEPAFTLGVEEEYLLVNPDTGDLVTDVPDSMMQQFADMPEGVASPEFLRSQIEVGTRKCETVAELGTCLRALRRRVHDVAALHNLAPIAASTHPFAQWSDQKHTVKDRYTALAKDYQAVARRLLISGMHVHVGIEDPDLRIDLMNQTAYFLPHLLALSTSSPFWRGLDTGLKSYRISVFNELPRTGLPGRFESYADYKRHIDIVVQAGLLEDASKIWWDLRPSATFPTLEMRITDICTRVDDTLCLAALYVCILRMLWRLRRSNQRWRIYAQMLVEENRWRAQRYGLDEGLVDFGKGQVVPMAALTEELIELTREDQKVLGCRDEVEHVRDIIARGTSAHAQRRTYQEAIEGGADSEDALREVVAMLRRQTILGV
ncbi:carboxylate-amine ligase [Roseospira marina]|uniref:Putative glutamate--cysteine ligase 2 n=1 Tax=Roseospira marina TaxID=140057 RepID=A0A5M6IC01_9PROT|nr:carboxylate-amine ligase [Roseospira marina]KAA5605487.1 carboxylate-amine ligase [Roseospira marina]MBB4314510.1 carboxylate-amine ligase [Roseospira marina]MBB5088662.1 carboxylate-amine ligase [Roseospira marina]